jgi:hypothetical protein
VGDEGVPHCEPPPSDLGFVMGEFPVKRVDLLVANLTDSFVSLKDELPQ